MNKAFSRFILPLHTKKKHKETKRRNKSITKPKTKNPTQTSKSQPKSKLLFSKTNKIFTHRKLPLTYRKIKKHNHCHKTKNIINKKHPRVAPWVKTLFCKNFILDYSAS
jgi:hypothetical protein